MTSFTTIDNTCEFNPNCKQRSSVLVRKGAWTLAEDELLKSCLERHGSVRWSRVPQLAGLNRCRKSCRLRWLNYLDPRIKRGTFNEDEDDLLIRLHNLLGNRWSLIAGRLPGRTANDVKNYWNSHLSKRVVDMDNRDGGKRRVATTIKPQPRTIPAKKQKTRKFERQQREIHPAATVENDDKSWLDHFVGDHEKHGTEIMEWQRQAGYSADLVVFPENPELNLEMISGWETLLSNLPI